MFPLQHVAIIGKRRSGKTSLLHYLQSITLSSVNELRPDQKHDWLPNPQQYQWIYIDFQDARMRQRKSLFRYILGQLQFPLPEQLDMNSFVDIVSDNLQRPTIILMDEIEAGLASPELDLPFWWNLRSLVTNQTRGKN